MKQTTFDSIAAFRVAVSKLILKYSILLLILGVLSLPGFVWDIELAPFIALITPINALYIGTVFKYIGTTINEVKVDELSEKDKKLAEAKLKAINDTAKLVFYLIPAHFVFIALLIIAKAWLGLINFQQMSIAFTILESFFGGYMGAIILPIFGKDDR